MNSVTNSSWHSSRKACFRACGGFTLIELLVAISILLLIVTIVYSSFNSTQNIVDRVESGMVNYHTAQRLFARLRNEMIALKWEPNHKSLMFNGVDTPIADTYNVELEEDEEGDDVAHMDSITFTAMLRSTVVKGEPVDSDLKQVEYSPTSPDSENGLFSIIHTVKSHFYIEGPLASRSYEIAKRVKSFNLRYCRNTSCRDDGFNSPWREGWEISKKNNIPPRLIEVTLVLVDKNNNEQRFKDIIKLLL